MILDAIITGSFLCYEWLCTEVLKYVPHRQWVFSIPKRLRIYFMFDRSLLAKLSRCAWKVLNLYLTQAVACDDAKAGAAVAVQSFGDFQNFHPHLHILSTDGCFYKDGAFMVCPPPDTGVLEKLLWLSGWILFTFMADSIFCATTENDTQFIIFDFLRFIRLEKAMPYLSLSFKRQATISVFLNICPPHNYSF